MIGAQFMTGLAVATFVVAVANNLCVVALLFASARLLRRIEALSSEAEREARAARHAVKNISAALGLVGLVVADGASARTDGGAPVSRSSE